MMRVALVHDWLTGMRGGEKCLEVLCRLWPDAHLYTLIHRRGALSPTIERMDIRTSFLQRVPGIFQNYRWFLPVMPAAIESFRLTGYDVVVSSSHCVAKSVRVPRGVPHVCYCFTPMRYAWHMRDAYWPKGGRRQTADGRRSQTSESIGPPAAGRSNSPLLSSFLPLSSSVWSLSSWLSCAAFSLVLADLRRWDRAAADRVTHFIAISRTVEQRIRECYGRDSVVICPPVNVEFFTPDRLPREDFYLCVAALVPYKRLDLAIKACNRIGRRLVVIGTGPEQTRLRALAGPTVSFLGWQSDDVIRDCYRGCRALLFPGLEDFGIVPLEAQACGAPVIAFWSGGATETVIPPGPDGPGTGLLFADQSVESLAEAIARFEADPDLVSPRRARANAERYRTDRFAEAMGTFVRGVMQGRDRPTSTELHATFAA